MLTLAGKHQLLNSLPTVWASVHTSYPDDAGANELAGGGYQRQPLTLASAANGKREIGSNPVLVMPTGSSAQWVGYWGASTGGVFLGCVPIGGKDFPYILTDDLFTIWAPGITLSANDRIVFTRYAPGLTVGTIYYARDVNGSSFRVSTTPGGVAAGLSYPAGRGTVGKITPLSFPAGGRITVNESTFDFGVHTTNAPPVWNAQNSFSLNIGSTLDLDTLCADPEGQTITYTLDPAGNPAGGIFSLQSNGVVTGLAAGTVTVIVIADDGN